MLASHFLARAGRELSVDPKILRKETIAYMQQLPWPGNVRQLENTCRWLTVMVTGREIFPEDLPAELRQLHQQEHDQLLISPSNDKVVTNTHVAISPDQWDGLLRQWAKQKLLAGEQQLLETALPLFERTMIDAALDYSHGRKRHAAELLGWGRNTLTRKLKELGISSTDDDEL